MEERPTPDMARAAASSEAPSLDEALRFWYGLINYEERQPGANDFKLERMQALLAALGDPQRRLRIVHIAGSKGKGSTSAMLAAILRRSGYRTGLFTSPHLCRVEERFQVDGQPITAQELATLLGEVRAVVSGPKRGKLPATPTFFEVATAVGFLHFVRRRVEAAVIEVGLGGRLDSTNVCQPVAALITSISHDHTRLLGDRLASIAREKAGIVKPGRAVISGATVPEARAVIETICRERKAPLRQLGVDFDYHYEPGRVTKTAIQRPRVQVTGSRHRWPLLELNLLGEHQGANAAVALTCIEILRVQGWQVPDTAVAAGLAEVQWPARLEVMGHGPLVVLDCAHNVASAAALVETLQTAFPPGRRLLVFAGSSDKDLVGMFRQLAPHFAHAFLTRYTDNPRSVAPEKLLGLLRTSGDLPATLCPSAAAAFAAAMQSAGPEDVIVITGSVFLAGELRPLVLRECGEVHAEPVA